MKVWFFFFSLDNRTGPPSDSLCHSFLRKYQRHNPSEEFIEVWASLQQIHLNVFPCASNCIITSSMSHIHVWSTAGKSETLNYTTNLKLDTLVADKIVLLYYVVRPIQPIQNNLASKCEVAALNMGRCDLTSGFRIVRLAFFCSARKYLFIKNVRMTHYATTKAHLCLWTAVLFTWC